MAIFIETLARYVKNDPVDPQINYEEMGIEDPNKEKEYESVITCTRINNGPIETPITQFNETSQGFTSVTGAVFRTEYIEIEYKQFKKEMIAVGHEIREVSNGR